MRNSLHFLYSAYRTARNVVVEDNVHADISTTDYDRWVSSQRHSSSAGDTRSREYSETAIPGKAKRE